MRTLAHHPGKCSALLMRRGSIIVQIAIGVLTGTYMKCDRVNMYTVELGTRRH